MRTNIVRLAVLMTATVCPLGLAASFDCDSPRLARTEKMICEQHELGRLDNDMAQAYRNAQMLARTPADVLVSQRRWLATRNQCGDAACVARAYQARLNELRQTPMATHQEFRDSATGLHFRYLGNRTVKRCTTDPGTVCFQLGGPGMAYGSAYFVQFELVDRPLAAVADSLWEKGGGGWVALGRWDARSPVTAFAGDGWQGLVANTVCGIGDEHGFHGAGGECFTYLTGDGHRSLIMTTDGASGRDAETQATIRSVKFGR
jgi:uncharacterized protein YecT (DUF1311 family)